MPRHGWKWKPSRLSAVVLALLLCQSLLGLNRAAAGPPETRQIDLQLPADIVYQLHVGPDSAVVFRHGTHFELAGRNCTSCHPQPFRMLSPTHRTSHQVMNAGGSCGSCHDGTRAFSVRDASSCRSCHSGRQARHETAAVKGPVQAPAPGGGPKPIAYARSDGSPGRVTFRHETHVRGTSCASCHPSLFRMKALAAPASAMHGAGSCGKCHDGKRAFGVEDAEKCARCHVAGKGAP